MARPSIRKQVLAALMRQLCDDCWPPGSPIPPSRQLAIQLAVSRPVILDALRQAAEMGLLAAAAGQQYTVAAGAPGMARQAMASPAMRPTHGRLAVLLPESEYPMINPFHISLVQHLTQEAERQSLHVQTIGVPLAEQEQALAQLTRQRYDAAVALSFSPAYSTFLTTARRQSYPLLVFNRYFPGLQLATIHLGQDEALRHIANRLLLLGHRNLCMVTHFSGAYSMIGYDPATVWLEYLQEKGLLTECTLPLRILPWKAGLRNNPHVFADIFQRPDRPTAVVFTSGLWAQQFLSDPRFQLLSVPEDISVAVLHPGTRPLLPGSIQLTNVDIDYRHAAQCILKTIGEMTSGAALTPSIRLAADINFTASIGPPPK